MTSLRRVPVLDRINQPTWAAWAPTFADADGWTDPGERNAVHSIADQARGGAILDVGVGAGRSTWMLRLLSDDYLAVDYSPEMVALFRARHPDTDILWADARRLGQIDDGSKDLVVFSFNGLDAVEHEGRLAALAELQRVLRPGGHLVFSGLNRDGPSYDARPWRSNAYSSPAHGRLWRSLRFAAGLPAAAPGHAARYRNWWRGRKLATDHGSWALGPLAEHDYGLVVHFTTLAEQRRQLAEAGLKLEAIWTDTGEPVELGAPSAASYHHFVARRPGRRSTD